MVDLCFEWPWHCTGWKLDEVKEIAKTLPFSCRFDGCCYGLKNRRGEPLRKEWLVRTTCSQLPRFLSRRCTGLGHHHAACRGEDGAQTAYYTDELVKAAVKGLLETFRLVNAVEEEEEEETPFPGGPRGGASPSGEPPGSNGGPSSSTKPLKPRTMRAPIGPSKEEWMKHQATHVPYKPWCTVCVQGRGQERPHRSVPEEHVGPVPLVELDFSFVRATRSEKVRPVLLGTCVQNKMGFAELMRAKGMEDPRAARVVTRFLEECGIFHKVTLRIDKEPAVYSNAKAVADIRGAQPTFIETVPAKSKGSIGAVDRLAQDVLAVHARPGGVSGLMLFLERKY